MAVKAQCLPERRFRRSLLTMLLSFALLVLYYTHWSPRAIARLLGVRSSRAPRHGSGGGSGGAQAWRRSSAGGLGGSEASLVWVLLGDTHYQPYLMESIRQARVFNPTELFFLVIEPRFWPSNHSWYEPLRQYNVNLVNYSTVPGGGGGLEDPFTHDFSKNYQRLWDELGRLLGSMMQPTINGKSNLDFTSHTMVRVVAVHQLMALHGLQRVVHIENDQMVYGSIQGVRAAADGCGIRLALTKLGARLSFATMYVRDARALKGMLDWILDAISHGTEHAIEVAQTKWVTDMSLPSAYLANRTYLGDDSVTTFPPEVDDTCLALASGYIFDALPLGTWCCGNFEHPKKHMTFKMTESYVKYWEKPFEWRVVEVGEGEAGWGAGVAGAGSSGRGGRRRLRVPVWNGTRVFNLHMHSKQLQLFRSTELALNATALEELGERN